MKQFWVIMLLGWTLPAAADLQTDMITDRLDRLDREMTLLQQKVYARDTPSRTEKTEKNTGTVSGEGLSELYAQLDDQNRVIADLTRKVEELSYAQSALKEQTDKIRQDNDVRFEALTQPGESRKSDAAPSQTDKQAYEAAYDLLVKTKYAAAEKAFRSFLKDYPKSNLAGNANYWLGETYYVRGQYDVAVGVFSDGLTKYETSAKAPDNLLKLGMTMARLNKKTEACGFLTLLPEKFPKAADTLKKRAAAEARKLSCP